MTTPLFLLRCVQLGISIGELDLLTIGLVNDMYVESRNDEHKYAVVATQKDFDLLTGIIYAFSTALGFALALIIFAGIREQLSIVNIPKGMQGMPIALITAGLLAMAFMGFSGVDKGLAALFGL